MNNSKNQAIFLLFTLFSFAYPILSMPALADSGKTFVCAVMKLPNCKCSNFNGRGQECATSRGEDGNYCKMNGESCVPKNTARWIQLVDLVLPVRSSGIQVPRPFLILFQIKKISYKFWNGKEIRETDHFEVNAQYNRIMSHSSPTHDNILN